MQATTRCVFLGHALLEADAGWMESTNQCTTQITRGGRPDLTQSTIVMYVNCCDLISFS